MFVQIDQLTSKLYKYKYKYYVLQVHINLGAGESEVSSPRGLRLDDLHWHAVKLLRWKRGESNCDDDDGDYGDGDDSGGDGNKDDPCFARDVC